MSITCIKFTPIERGALRGICDLVLTSGIAIHDVLLMESNGRRWINLPGKPALDKEKNLLRGEGSRISYVPVLTIPDRARRDTFNATALKAIDEFRASQPAPKPKAAPSPQVKPEAGRPFSDNIPF